jgi:hypothetical protein
MDKEQLLNWLAKEFNDSDLQYREFKAQEEAEDYGEYETTISRLTEDGFRSALQYVIDYVKGQ